VTHLGSEEVAGQGNRCSAEVLQEDMSLVRQDGKLL